MDWVSAVPGGRGAVREFIEVVLRAQGRWDGGRGRARRAALMDGSLTLLAVLIALLAGLAIGKAWERYKLKDGRWIDRRRGRESPHYILGLNFLVANQIDPAIDELTKAAELAGDPLEIRLILGNLYREKGQVGRAIQEHQSLLQRPSIRKLEHANVLLCLGLDYKSGGFVDRALSAFTDVLRLDPDNRYALSNLEKLLRGTAPVGRRLQDAAAAGGAGRPRAQAAHLAILAFPRERARHPGAEAHGLLRGRAPVRGGDRARRRQHPAYLNLGDVHFYLGDVAAAMQTWERLIERSPERAYLTFSRLEGAYRTSATRSGFPSCAGSLIAADPAGLARAPRARPPPRGQGQPREALELLFDALVQQPARAVACTRRSGRCCRTCSCRRRSSTSTSTSRAAPSSTLDPHICVRCRYRSTELLWQCPHCHEWNTFVEERIAPAKDTEATLTLATRAGHLDASSCVRPGWDLRASVSAIVPSVRIT